MIKNIEAMIIEYSRAPSYTMRNIKNGRKKTAVTKMIGVDTYISAIVSCPDSANKDNKEEDEELGIGEH